MTPITLPLTGEKTPACRGFFCFNFGGLLKYPQQKYGDS